MRYCKTCNAYVAEPFGKCPLCQNEMIHKEGISEEYYIFPDSDGIRKRSKLFKVLIYLALLAAVVALCLDVVLGLHGGLHWSVIVVVGCAFLMVAIVPLVVRVRPFGEVVWNIGFWGIVGAVLITWYLNAWNVLMELVLPILLILLLVVEFIVVLIEKYAGSMAFYMTVVVGTLALWGIRTLLGAEVSIMMNIAISLAAILSILLVAVKSEHVLCDLKKKFSI